MQKQSLTQHADISADRFHHKDGRFTNNASLQARTPGPDLLRPRLLTNHHFKWAKKSRKSFNMRQITESRLCADCATHTILTCTVFVSVERIHRCLLQRIYKIIYSQFCEVTGACICNVLCVCTEGNQLCAK